MGTCRAPSAYDQAVVVAWVLFAVVGVVATAVRVAQRRWFLAVASMLGPGSAELGLAAMTFHQLWITIVATAVALAAGGFGLLDMRREVRVAGEQQPS